MGLRIIAMARGLRNFAWLLGKIWPMIEADRADN
jgi:hypothetical protein